MTPEQLAVERDWLLEHGRTPEEVASMQAAATGFLQLRVAETVRRELTQALADAGRQLPMYHSISVIGRFDLWPIVDRFSPPKEATHHVTRAPTPAIHDGADGTPDASP